MMANNQLQVGHLAIPQSAPGKMEKPKQDDVAAGSVERRAEKGNSITIEEGVESFGGDLT
ncbi:hypothetical protein AKJ65_05335 [candidate division MSBL1 archaeon SCGC-AAA259E19]|uniref:Uncharacterized protein n=1 Tax=candidate division MSBL1 archaeon SCGC-AAA259E19 TaxID=1698264 RepID=A0A133UIU7_9EURY|nr:hypothetical protein AKJ65_05335 [candidate division MSBL1 archaeon SCGC-AAA259E19]